MDGASDGELLELAREGDPDAFSALIRRHDRYLYRVARSVLQDDDEAEDVVQQTYLQAYISFVDFRREANLRTWLTRIALNDALQRRRRRRATVELSQRARAHPERYPFVPAGKLDTRARNSTQPNP
jgi:RNA polymerase sigma-70 factor, ECF subfamily